MSVSQFAKVTRVEPQTVRDWIRSGVIKGKKIGSNFIIKQSEIEKAINRPNPKYHKKKDITTPR